MYKIGATTCLNESGQVVTCRNVTTTQTQPKINVNSGGVIYQTGQTTTDKILATVLSIAALAKGAAYVPTTQQPQQQPVYSTNGGLTREDVAALLAEKERNTSENLGGQLQEVIKQNAGWILLGLGAFALIQMKPFSRK